jgi:hypothetical protein
LGGTGGTIGNGCDSLRKTRLSRVNWSLALIEAAISAFVTGRSLGTEPISSEVPTT